MLNQAMVRSIQENDHDLVMQTWLRHLRKTFSWLPSEAYFRLYERQIREHLHRGVAIALCNPDYPRQVFAYAVASPWTEKRFLLHFIFAKDYYRHGGLATRLVQELCGQMLNAHDEGRCTATNWSADLERMKKHVDGYRPDLFNSRACYHHTKEEKETS